MSAGWLQAAVLAAALGSGLMAGLFFAFSNFVMRALGRLPPEEGVAAMQAINKTVQNALFFLVFFGTAALSLLLAVLALVDRQGAGSGLLLAGALSYLFGNLAVTVGRNVPLNQALARRDPAAAETAAYWRSYQRAWTAWNHLRSVSGAAAMLLFAAARARGTGL